MKIAVAMKQIPDLQQVRIKDRKAVLAGVQKTFGEIDKRALEAAVKLKETCGDATVCLLSVGDDDLEDTASEALAAGADEAFLIADEDLGDLDSAQAAEYLAYAIRQMGDVDLVLFGEASGDNFSGQVASRVAAIAGMPLVGYASSIEFDGAEAKVACSYEDAIETVTVPLPAVVSVASEIAEVRIPSVMAILKANRKPKEILEKGDVEMDVEPQASVRTMDALAPLSDRKCVKVADAAALVAALGDEKAL